MGDCQNYGPFLGPCYSTGPNTGPNLGDPKRDHNFDNPPYEDPGVKGPMVSTSNNRNAVDERNPPDLKTTYRKKVELHNIRSQV